MPDWGAAYYPMNEASGLVAYDTGGAHNGQYYYQTYNNYQGTEPTTPAELQYRIAAPTVTGYAMGFNILYNGRPNWSSSYNWTGMRIPTTSGGWGNMADRQPFTISMVVRWHGVGGTWLRRYVSFAGGGGSGYYTGMYTPENYNGYSFGEPKLLTFTRWSGSGAGATSVITSSVDTPALVDYNNWDDWGGGLYQEPIKIGAWFQLVLRYDGDYKSMWIDGVKVAEDTEIDNHVIGSFSDYIWFGNQSVIDMAELGIWHRALTDEEITGG